MAPHSSPVVLLLLCCLPIFALAANFNKVYASWHCSDDGCSWGSQPALSSFDWIVNRGDGKPTFNILNLAFVNPITLLNSADGIPKGMTSTLIQYLQGKGITVVLSIGGASYSPLWDQALGSSASQLGKNAAAVAQKYNVGIEIDYEQDSSSQLANLDTFVKAFRAVNPFESGNNPSPKSILTIDLGAGTGFLTQLSKQTSTWLSNKQINWAYAMVSGEVDPTLAGASQYWQQHLDGASWAQIPPMAPSDLVVCLYASSNSKNCKNYSGTVLEGTVGWVNSKQAKGISFWAAGCPAGPSQCAQNCTGIITGSKNFLG